MTTATKHPIINPASHDLLDCKRLYMSLWSLERTLDGAKTVTRRLLNPQPPNHADRVEIRDSGPAGYHENGEAVWAVSREYEPGEIRLLATPHWRAGTDTEMDRVWDSVTRITRFSSDPEADLHDDETEAFVSLSPDWHQIYAGFLMPRWACRVAVRIVDVRVEQLGDMTARDCIREGVDDTLPDWGTEEGRPKPGTNAWLHARFRRKWEDLHGADSWDSEQWVRRIEYELIQQ